MSFFTNRRLVIVLESNTELVAKGKSFQYRYTKLCSLLLLKDEKETLNDPNLKRAKELKNKN